MLRCLAAVGLMCSTPTWAAPGDVNAQAFYVDAVALEDRGMRALFDKRLKPMVAQMRDAGMRSGAANKAATAVGKPIYCMSKVEKKAIDAKDVIAMLGRVPDSERRSSTLFEAWKGALAREFPCR